MISKKKTIPEGMALKIYRKAKFSQKEECLQKSFSRKFKLFGKYLISKQRRPLNIEENPGNPKNDENQGDIILYIYIFLYRHAGQATDKNMQVRRMKVHNY